MTTTGPIELAQTAKRDSLQELERKYQARWEAERIFEVEAPTIEETKGLTPTQIQEKYPKWFGNTPFPYMNGSLTWDTPLHFQDEGCWEEGVVPYGFHVTGMPIKLFGEDFSGSARRRKRKPTPPSRTYSHEDDPDRAATQGAPASSTPPPLSSRGCTCRQGKEGQAGCESHRFAIPFQIMESIGVPREEIKKFADPYYWLEYFPPIVLCSDHGLFGTRIDWRRSFLTTDANPTTTHGQPCMDHDRSEGEALGPQEYTLIKMPDKLNGRKVSWSPQPPTRDYVWPDELLVSPLLDTEAFVCTLRSARNMAFQGNSAEKGKVTQLLEINGKDLIGTKVGAPFCLVNNGEVYVLPMESILPTKGTGVVTSVPSDSPDDYATLMDLRKKADFYKIDPKWASFDPLPVISTPTYGEMTAPALVQKLKINSPKDAKQLAEAKEIAYKEGFYNGTMLVGEFKGLSVQDAKPKVRESMIQKGGALASGDECVVALMDQWYLDYGEPVWRAEAEKLLAKMETYNAETRNGFEGVLAWLNKWACARTYVPCESLSDSTIYMAYYTVPTTCTPGLLPIKPEQMTDQVWEHIFRDVSKMSKSKGNTLTMRQGIEKFDANFDEKTANASILRLYTLINWCEEQEREKSNYNYKDALKYGFYELQSARDWYREVTSDHIWTEILKEPKSVQHALWPTPSTPPDHTILDASMRDAEVTLLKKMGKKPRSIRVYVATSFPEWQDKCVQVVKEAYDQEKDKVDDVKVRSLLTERGLIKDKRAMPFVQAFKKRISQFGATTAFNRTVPFSEVEVLNEIAPT
ncbi:hypothetical protein BC629DRAFT_1550026 [Irpex lacteus]|nr:hypothetical protein BC629DRAFT_1550026 [Irpex lacteus]